MRRRVTLTGPVDPADRRWLRRRALLAIPLVAVVVSGSMHVDSRSGGWDTVWWLPPMTVAAIGLGLTAWQLWRTRDTSASS